MIKRIIRWGLITGGSLFIIALVTITPVDRTHFLESDHYKITQNRLDSLKVIPNLHSDSQLEVGWGKVNITPRVPTPLSGYGSRKGALSLGIHDSLWARSFVFKNQTEKIAFVTLDALLVPPAVTNQLIERLPSIGYDIQHVYLTATHTHSSMGAWGNSFIGEMFAGEFDQNVVNQLTSNILDVIRNAENNVGPAQIGYAEYNAPKLVSNRLVGKRGIIDPWFRVVKIQKNSGETALLTTFSAHATCLSSDELKFSRGYPGALVDSLESLTGIDFAAFAAGGVGSHRPESGGFGQYERTRWLASSLKQRVNHELIPMGNTNPLSMVLFNFPLREAHWRFSENWRFKPWVFHWLSEESPQFITVLQIGSVIFCGTPCDFSGELIPEIKAGLNQPDLNLVITSFNGGYIGYITKDCWYDVLEYETYIMNWFGPNNGQYFVNIIRNLVNIITS